MWAVSASLPAKTHGRLRVCRYKSHLSLSWQDLVDVLSGRRTVPVMTKHAWSSARPEPATYTAQDAVAHLHEMAADHPTMLRRAFARADADNDGMVDKEELRSFLDYTGCAMTGLHFDRLHTRVLLQSAASLSTSSSGTPRPSGIAFADILLACGIAPFADTVGAGPTLAATPGVASAETAAARSSTLTAEERYPVISEVQAHKHLQRLAVYDLEVLRHAFAAVDSNGDEIIPQEEFAAMLALLGLRLAPPDLTALFYHFRPGPNGDGTERPGLAWEQLLHRYSVVDEAAQRVGRVAPAPYGDSIPAPHGTLRQPAGTSLEQQPQSLPGSADGSSGSNTADVAATQRVAWSDAAAEEAPLSRHENMADIEAKFAALMQEDEPMVRMAFRRVDEDGDGIISVPQFRAMLSALGLVMSQGAFVRYLSSFTLIPEGRKNATAGLSYPNLMSRFGMSQDAYGDALSTMSAGRPGMAKRSRAKPLATVSPRHARAPVGRGGSATDSSRGQRQSTKIVTPRSKPPRPGKLVQPHNKPPTPLSVSAVAEEAHELAEGEPNVSAMYNTGPLNGVKPDISKGSTQPNPITKGYSSSTVSSVTGLTTGLPPRDLELERCDTGMFLPCAAVGPLSLPVAHAAATG